MVILPISYRYAFSSNNKHRVVSFVIVIALAIGMMAIISILSVMNSLQDELINELKTIESFHIEVSELELQQEEDVIDTLKLIDNVIGVYPYIETRVILQNPENGNSVTSRMRGVHESLFKEQNPLSDQIVFLNDSEHPFSLKMGYSLYKSLQTSEDKDVSISYLGKGKAVSLTLKTLTVPIGGIFYSPLLEFDSSTFYIDLDVIKDEIGREKIVYGLYLEQDNVRHILEVKERILEMFPDASISSWQEIHAPFYSALLLEKMLMYLFLLCIFVIVAINIKNSTNRLIHAKERELAILRALGARKNMVRTIIITSSMIITITGVTIGIILGVLVSMNIRSIFSVLNIVYHTITNQYNMMFSYPIEAQITAVEIMMITAFVLTISFIFTYFGTRRLLSKEPMEMLNHE
jgi:lipoprotein-releasing system permease protein